MNLIQTNIIYLYIQKGLCKGSSFDAHYGLSNEYYNQTENYQFSGFKSSLINYDFDKLEWKLGIYDNPLVCATYNGTSLYPFGSNDWYVYNDTCKDVDKFGKEMNKMMLNLNACDPNSEYNCVDGTW